MKLYMTPGSCSTGIHILLEELELVFEAHIINLLAGDQHKADYLAMNPKGTIPALQKDDGSALRSSLRSLGGWQDVIRRRVCCRMISTAKRKPSS